MQVVRQVCSNKLRTFAYQSTARSLCVSCGAMNKYAAREGRFLAKVMKSGPKKKKYWSSFEDNSVPSATQMASAIGGKSAKRVAVLNKLFMKNITGLMATGEVAAEILGKGIEISKVKVASDFNLVNVYWCAKGDGCDEDIEKTLQSVAGQLRHELSQLRVMGVVPRIQFVKDKHYSKTAEVERLLQTADFGEDYVPSTDGSSIRSEFTEEYTLNQRKEEKKDCKDDLLNEVEYDDDDLDLPVMRMDVLGVDHSAIMKKIVRSMKKAKASHRFECPEKPLGTLSESDTDQNIAYLTPKQQRLELSKFLTQRKNLKNKTRTRSNVDLDMLDEDNVTHNSSFSQFLDDDKEEQDFIEYDDSYLRRH
ncbi:putative ribosome-binding factor A, mitochondrial [Schistocerca americana]|uniref:putative ribosome-binding factor A, mitochondrial n=1 Tax=Schistocerca americana TaxID=7009 RepID=UPI001F4FFA6A|nr:putative ribosome-binding factor A, mitochondrial [Schistocerca americana]